MRMGFASDSSLSTDRESIERAVGSWWTLPLLLLSWGFSGVLVARNAAVDEGSVARSARRIGSVALNLRVPLLDVSATNAALLSHTIEKEKCLGLICLLFTLGL